MDSISLGIPATIKSLVTLDKDGIRREIFAFRKGDETIGSVVPPNHDRLPEPYIWGHCSPEGSHTYKGEVITHEDGKWYKASDSETYYHLGYFVLHEL